MNAIDFYLNGFILSDKWYNAFIALIIGFVLGYKFIDKLVIGVPNAIYLIYVLLNILTVIVLFKKKSFSFRKLVKLLLVNYIVFYVFVYLGFCSISIWVSSDSKRRVVDCPLVGATSSLRNNALYYKLDSSTYRFGAYGKMVSQLSKEKNYSDYKVRLRYREGLFGSKKIEDIDLVRK